MVAWHSRYNLGDLQPASNPGEWRRELACEYCPRLETIIENWLTGFTFLDYESVDEHIDSMVDAVLEKNCVILPLFLYDHSGLSMNTKGFSCKWDSGQVGYVYCDIESARKHFAYEDSDGWDTESCCGGSGKVGNFTIREKTEQILVVEVETYSQFLGGDVYGFIVEESPDEEGDDWDHVDSCWGFFGRDPDKNGMVDHLPEELAEMARQAE
jgi:hypothetical protein